MRVVQRLDLRQIVSVRKSKDTRVNAFRVISQSRRRLYDVFEVKS
jgi:hypothetical protein